MDNLDKNSNIHHNDDISSRDLIRRVRIILRRLFNLTDGADFENTSKGIKEDISFKGHKLWVLIFSIFIASIGLDANSTAVIIGAMLISPLMGPIIGIGYSIGVYDIDLFKSALRNLAIATVIAIITSTLYFLVSPFSTAQSELLARTRPTLLDVLIAFFGGLAGIVGSSRKEKGTVIAGVAIATALMPPLCTAGFGLATGQFQFFFGAFYLYIINSIFIALATFIMVRFMPFPKKQFLNPSREKRVKQLIWVITIVVIVPSIIMAYSVVKENNYNKNVKLFINTVFKQEKSEIINYKINYHAKDSSNIEIFIFGAPYSDASLELFSEMMPKYGLPKTKLTVYQNTTEDTKDLVGKIGKELKTNILQDLYTRSEAESAEKDKQIQMITQQLEEYENPEIVKIAGELKIVFPKLEQIAINKTLMANAESQKLDTVYIALVRWEKGTPKHYINSESEKMQKLLETRLSKKKISIVSY